MIKLRDDQVITALRALYWYEDKLTNTSLKDESEWDDVVWLRGELSDYLKTKAYLK